MKSIKITKSQCKRELSGLIQKIVTGKLDKISIYKNGERIAVLVSPCVVANPLLNSLDELREAYNT